MQYVGETGRQLYKRGREHLYNIDINKEAIGEHFNSKGHAKHHFTIQVIEKVVPDTVNFRLERESMWIRKLDTRTPRGLNINEWNVIYKHSTKHDNKRFWSSDFF